MATNAMPKQTHFRFLDLPPEIRNRIYETLSRQAFSIPLKVTYVPAQDRLPQDTLGFVGRRVNESMAIHDSHRGLEHRNRLAILLTNRQVYKEASKLFFSNMTLDLQHIYYHHSLRSMRALTSTFKFHLQHIRHTEMDAATMRFVLFTPARDQNRFKGSFSSDEQLHQALLLRTRLFAPKSVTVNDVGATGFLTIAKLCESAHILHRLFPQLEDIATVNAYGGERFRKRADGKWELWYTKEVIPTRTVGLKGRLFPPGASRPFDTKTQLSIAETLDYFRGLGPESTSG